MSGIGFFEVFFLLCFVTAARGSEWGPWQQSSSTAVYRRFKACPQFSTTCISREEISGECFNLCKDVGTSIADANSGFGICTTLCYNGVHTRSLSCGQNTSCTLTQFRACVNELHCVDGNWGAWKSFDPTIPCNATVQELVIRRCIQTVGHCTDEASGGPPFQLDFWDCPDATTSLPLNMTSSLGGSLTTGASTVTSPATTTSERPIVTTRTRSPLCGVDDCLSWKNWGNWEACSSVTGKRQRSRDCEIAATSCQSQLLTNAVSGVCTTAEPDQQLVVILGSSAAGVVLLVVVVFVSVKCCQERSLVVNQTVNTVNLQAATHNYNTTRLGRPDSPGYQYPIDSIRSTRILMEGDSIYATVT